MLVQHRNIEMFDEFLQTQPHESVAIPESRTCVRRDREQIKASGAFVYEFGEN